VKTLLLFSLFVAVHFLLNGQDTLNSNRRVNPQFWFHIYPKNDINLNLQSTPTTIVAKLYDLQDSGLLISKTSKVDLYRNGDFETTELKYPEIKFVSYRNNQRIISYAVALGVVGFISGAIIGSNIKNRTEDDWDGGWYTGKLLDFMGYGFAIGAGTGALTGSIKTRISIDGIFDKYQKNKLRLQKQSVKFKYLSVD